MHRIVRYAALALIIACFTIPAGTVQAQYFGRNKVQYDKFKFKSFETEHFEIFFYDETEETIRDVAAMAERWYQRHSRTFLREFHEKKPLIFYANDADFHQTNAVSGSLGEGTGGVTESLKERVVMPLTGIYAETDHVLGHELVHSFQYDIGLSTTDSTRFALGLFPLWVIEGTAEYLSVGREDSHTAMWLRDAAMNDDLPTAEQLTKEPHKYFPYRYGQAYMAYIGGKYGDAAVTNLFKLGGRAGLDSAFVYALGITADSLSKEWISAVKETYLPLTTNRTEPTDAGRLVISEDLDGGKINLAPTTSPDGRYVAFISERDIFSINLFIADAETGEVIQRLKNGPFDSHFDNIRFISSAGSWSPDGKKFAFVVFSEGDNEIQILDIDSGKVERRITVADVGAMHHVAWSPDNQSLAFSGIQGGISNLFLLNLETNSVRQLTDDRYADLQPTWSPDGETIAFVTDRGPDGTDFETLYYGKMRLALINLESEDIQVVRPFEGAMHHNPQFSPDGRDLFFISDQDGFKDIYRHELNSTETFRITNLKTGISGITALSPAMTVAMQSGRMMFTVFNDGSYPIYSLEADELEGESMTQLLVDGETTGEDAETLYADASILPPQRNADEGLVGSYLSDPLTGLPDSPDYDIKDYGARLRLDYVAPPSVGVSVGGPFGGGAYGGVGFFFSDMLGNHNLAVIAQANGTLKDIGGQVSYLNQKNRFNYGGAVGHIPILYGYLTQGIEPIFDENGEITGALPTYDQVFRRIYIDQLDLMGSYPLSSTRRLELSGGFARYAEDIEIRRYVQTFGGLTQGERINRDDLEADPFYFFQAGVSFVGDNSSFGFTSPVRGGRFRLQVSPYVGSADYVRVLGDYRRYFLAKPVTFAIRGLHVGNYGAPEGLNTTNSNSFDSNIFTRQYLGYPNYLGFVRGYSFNSFDPEECTPSLTGSCVESSRLIGTRIALTSAEVRVPLFGASGFGLINFPYLPTEISLFFDAGLAWNEGEDFFSLLKFDRDGLREEAVTFSDGTTGTSVIAERIPVFSTGVATRFNLFGYTVLELFYAYPFQRPDKGAHIGFQLIPGW
ncbi:MAG: peptidase S9 [Rhodothermales bacterium]